MTRPSTRSVGRRTTTEPPTSPRFTERSATKTSVTPLISSPSGLVQVLDFSPTEGGWGTPVTVRIKFKYNALPALCTRLVFGRQAVNTTVQEFSAAGLAGWQLDAAIPRLASDTKIPMIVQVLDMNSKVIESLTFAEFTYRALGLRNSVSRSQSPAPKIKRCSSRPLPSSTARHVSSSATSVRKSQFHRRKAPYCVSGDSDDDSTPVLRLITPLETMCSDWSDEELSQGRRLVKFYKFQQGRDLLVSCEPLMQEDYHESDTVISCIYRRESQEFFATSVDIIYLLEKLTNDEFPVEEKNRIRRNLEGLHPVTVSKHKHGFERFFQSIMKFPEPRPRNIEKDLKVFSWHLLGQALAKILSKYTIVGPSPKTRVPKVEEPVLVPNQDWETYFLSDQEKRLMSHIRPSHTLKRETLLPSYFVNTSEDSPLPVSVSLPDTEYDYWSPEEAVDANLAKAARYVMPKEEPFEDSSLSYPYDSW